MGSLRDTYNQIARDWAHDHQSDIWWISGTNTLLNYLWPGAHILDVGCGSGWKSKYLLNRGFHVTGIDFSDSMIELAREQAPEADFYVLDLMKLGEISKEFDAIFAQAVLLHIPKRDIRQAIFQLRTKLALGGYMYLAVKRRQHGQPEEEIKTERDYGYEYQRFFSYYTQPEIEKLLVELGFCILWIGVTSVWIQFIAQKQS